MSSTKNIVVLISGNGSNLQAIIDSIHSNPKYKTRIGLVLSNRKAAFGLERARRAGIPTAYFPLKPYKDAGKSRQEYDRDLADEILKMGSRGGGGLADEDGQRPVITLLSPQKNIDLIVLAGFMHILSPEFLDRMNPKTATATTSSKAIPIINLHPALPGAFDGAEAIPRAFEAFQKGLITGTGCMMHYVIPEVDRGDVICSVEVEIRSGDTLGDLEQRIHSKEHALIVEGVKRVLGLPLE